MNKALSIHALLMFTFALGVAVWSFFLFGSTKASFIPEWEKTGQMELDSRIVAQDLSLLRRNGRDAVVLFPGAQAELIWDSTEESLDVNLYAGSVLVGAQAGDFSVNVDTDFARVEAQYNTVWVSLAEDASSLDVYALRGSSTLSFMQEGEVLNALPVPTHMRVKVAQAKVTPTLGRLRLTKLSKEFPVFPLTEKEMSAELSAALEELTVVYQKSAERTVKDLQAQSDFGPPLSGFGARLASFLSRFESFATLLPHAEERLEGASRQESLRYAVTNFLYGKEDLGGVWLQAWQEDPSTLEELKPLYVSLFFVLPGDDLYPVKKALMQVFAQNDVFGVLRQQMQEVQELLDRGDFVEAKKAYDAYAQVLEQSLDSGFFDSAEGAAELAREYVLLERMLREQAVFYTVDAVALLSKLEAKLLLLVATDADIDEERQAFVQSKLRFLERLFELLMDGQIPLDRAGVLAESLINSAEADLAALSGDAAVRLYFKDQLADFSVALQFMSSPEFFTYSSFDEGLVDFQAKLEDLKNLNAYLQSIRSDSDVELSPLALQEAIVEVGTLLTSNGIQYQDIISLEDADYRLFKIQGGRVDGFAFEAKFDLQTQIFYDVELGDVRFSTGLRLDNLGSVFSRAQEQVFDADLPEDVTENEDEASLTETVALEYAEDGFIAAGLNPESFSFTLESLDENLFRFEGSLGAQEVLVSGLYSADDARVMELNMDIAGSSKTLPSMALSQMESAVLATYEALSARKSVN